MTLNMTMSGNLPENNGVEAIRNDLIRDGSTPRVAVVLFNVRGGRWDQDSGEKAPTLRILTIEPVFGDAKAAAEELAREAYSSRTGENVLPFEDTGDGGEPEGDPDGDPDDAPEGGGEPVGEGDGIGADEVGGGQDDEPEPERDDEGVPVRPEPAFSGTSAD